MEVYVDSVKGTDDTGDGTSPDKSFKTFDIAYQKTREKTLGVVSFKISGSHEMTLSSYSNINLHEVGISELLVNRHGVSLNNCFFNLKVTITMDGPETVFKVDSFCSFSKSLSIAEKKYRGYGNLSAKTIIKNDGKLLISGDVNIKADRNITFVNNNGHCESAIPGVECSGGYLFVSEKNKFVKLYTKVPTIIKVGYVYNEGVITSSKLSPNFSIYKGYGPLLCNKAEIKTEIHGTSLNYLFNFEEGKPEMTYPSGLEVPVDSTTIGFIYNSKIDTNTPKGSVILSNNQNIKLISTLINGQPYYKDNSDKIKEISADYVVSDYDSDKLFVRCVNNVKITIPEESNIEKLYIKKLNISTYTVTITSKLMPEGVVTLNSSRMSCVKLIKHEGKLYIKYKC